VAADAVHLDHGEKNTIETDHQIIDPADLSGEFMGLARLLDNANFTRRRSSARMACCGA
jgi:hypothetical protein